MEVGDGLRRILEVMGWFPRVLRDVVSLPVYEVLELASTSARIFDGLHLVFLVSVDEVR